MNMTLARAFGENTPSAMQRAQILLSWPPTWQRFLTIPSPSMQRCARLSRIVDVSVTRQRLLDYSHLSPLLRRHFPLLAEESGRHDLPRPAGGRRRLNIHHREVRQLR